MGDHSSDGTITLAEFESHLQDPNAQAYFNSVLEIDINDAFTFFTVLDQDEDAVVDIDTFVEGCLRLKGPAKRLDFQIISLENRWLRKKFFHFAKNAQKQLDYLCKEADL